MNILFLHRYELNLSMVLLNTELQLYVIFCHANDGGCKL